MAFIVTARKWRPQKFNEVVGQEHITTTLKNALKNNRIAHAYLFTGPRGVGKTTTARLMAKTLNCLNPIDYEPCNNCEMCNSITNNQSLDIIEIDGASNRGIDEIRTLRDSVKYAPTKGKYKVYIIDEVHMLTRESFNAFLKTLEEPPSHTIFIFATTDVHKVPLTIISRCQRYDFRRIQLDTIKTLLAKIAVEENIEIDDKTLTIIAKKADGALRDAESFFDQVVSFCGNKIDSSTVSQMLNLIDDEIYFQISDAVITKNYKTVFDVSTNLYENGWNFIDFMDGLVEHFRNIMTVIVTHKTDLVESADVFKNRYPEYLDKFSEGDLLRILNFLNKTHQELRFTQNQKLKIEIALSHLIALERSATITGLLKTLDSGDYTTPPAIKPTSQPEDEKKNFDIDENKKTVQVVKPLVEVSQSEPAIIKTVVQKNIDFTFSDVVKKWEGLVESVCSEKSFLLGPFIRSINIEKLEGQKLFVNSPVENAEEAFHQNKKYLHEKIQTVYGKKFSLYLNPVKPPLPESRLGKNNTKSSTPLWQDDEVIDAIKKELNGIEIS
ncbi:MAG: DNA polymerase III subunit gamma/tau [Ignavibacteriaceae bacterium]|nr:DNA polymerase III subunit gamma/tau [Ignavibacteriaceae bacterium]